MIIKPLTNGIKFKRYLCVFAIGGRALLEAADATIGAVGRVIVLVAIGAEEPPQAFGRTR